MRKLIITEWVSLDGIFDAASMDKWFNPFHSESRAKQIQETINNCDVLLYGRVTYEMLYPYWSALQNNEMGVAEKLNKAKKYVVSSKLKKAPWENSVILGKNFIKELEKIKAEDGGYILMQGSSSLVKPLLEAGLVDELRLLINPYIMGDGARLFSEEIHCKLAVVKQAVLENGVIAVNYQPIQ
jgi:dihydrofolate reductase